MKYANEDECVTAGLDPKTVEAIARRLSSAARDAKRLGLVIFGGSGHGSLRFNDSEEVAHGALIVARLDGQYDGGDGGYGPSKYDGLNRGEHS